jgi:hypothetical protein
MTNFKAKPLYTISKMTSFEAKAKGGTFVLIMDFFNHKWKPCHLTINLFQTTNIFGFGMPM